MFLITSFVFAQERYENAKYYYREAQYSSLRSDYEKAIREAQYALERFLDERNKNKAQEMKDIIQSSRKIISEIEDNIKKAIKNGTIIAGMTKEEVIESWGKPRDINRTVTSYSVHEQWCYGDILAGTDRYIYFDENEVVTSWQD